MGDIHSWAERRDALVGLDAARKSGLSDAQVRRRAKSEQYRRVRRTVYAINGAPPTWRQSVRAVLLAHDGLVASHETALRLLGGQRPAWGDAIHVSGDMRTQVRLPGVVGHRSGTFAPNDRTERDGLACTAPVRTVIDLSGLLDERELGDVVDDLLRRRVLRLAHLRARVATTLPAPGRSLTRLRAVLAARLPGYDPGESALEAKIIRALVGHGIPLPAQQLRVDLGGSRYRLDFAWPDRRVYLEGNGFGWHRLSTDLDSDARRQNMLVIDGWRPIEITWTMSEAEIAATASAVLRRC
jgi:very-short-patch-repair endonuclease